MGSPVTLLLAALALAGLAAASIYHVPHVPVTTEMLTRQKKMVQILRHVSQPIMIPELLQIAKTYRLEDNVQYFRNPEIVTKFVKYYQHGYFKRRGEHFSIYWDYDQMQARLLVDLLCQARDFNTFYNTAVWARHHLNDHLFTYSFLVAKHQRHDCYDVVLPPLYDIQPQLYLGQEVIDKAWEATLQGRCYDQQRPYVIWANYSGYPYVHDANGLLSYFTEDRALGTHLDYLHYRSPFWARLGDYNSYNYTHRGAHFYYTIKTILSRYNLERLSNHLPLVEPYEYKWPAIGIKQYRPFTQHLSTLESRLWGAVDSGYVFDTKFNRHSLRSPLSLEIFGRIVEGNADCINRDYYGSFYTGLLQYLGNYGSYGNSLHGYGGENFFLGRPGSACWRPQFYQILQRVGLIFDRYYSYLGPYQRKELWVPGVKVESVKVDKLVTYYRDCDIELNNAIPVKSYELASKLNVVARTSRLAHKPFNYHVKVVTKKETQVVVRFFIGPRYDVYGNKWALDKQRHNFVLIDSFTKKLTVGENVLVRNSNDFNLYGHLPHSYNKLYQTTVSAIRGRKRVYMDDFVNKYGDMQRLLLPRGTYHGLPLSTYVIVTPVSHQYGGWGGPSSGWGSHYVDNIGAKFSLFPFDRPIYNDLDFHVPNAHFGDALVYHKDAGDVVIG